MSLIRLCFLILSAALALGSGAASAEFYARIDGDRVLVIISDTPPDDPRYLLYKKDRLGDIDPIAEEKPDALSGGDELAPSKFNGHILAAARETKVDVALIRAVISVESGYNASARSRAGAVGLMQLMPGTAKRYGVRNRLDPAQNIHGGARYLRDLQVMFDNNLQLVLAAYNAGEFAVMKYGRRIPPYRETVAYVPKVLSYYKKFRAAASATPPG
jgi:soluble lytic murein transglycosylase-like protein